MTALSEGQVRELGEKLQPIWPTREGEAPAEWWYADFAEAGQSSRNALVIGEEWDVRLCLLRSDYERGDAIVAALPQVPALIETALSLYTRISALEARVQAAEARAEALGLALEGVLDEAWDGRRVWRPDPSTCEAAYAVLRTPQAAALAQVRAQGEGG